MSEADILRALEGPDQSFLPDDVANSAVVVCFGETEANTGDRYYTFDEPEE